MKQVIFIILSFAVISLAACGRHIEENVNVPDTLNYDGNSYFLTSVVYKDKGFPNADLVFTHRFTEKHHQKIYINREKGYLYVRTRNDHWVQYREPPAT